MKLRTAYTFWLLSVLASCGDKANLANETDGDASVRDDDDSAPPGDDDSTENADDTDDDAADDDTDPPPSGDDILLDPEPIGVDAGPDEEVIVSFDGGDGGIAACGGDAVNANQKEVSLLLVFDQSGSMLETDPDGLDRWTLLTQATATTLEAVKDKMSLGLELYPNRIGEAIPEDCSTDGSCCAVPDVGEAIVVPIEEGLVAADTIMDSLSNAAPAGGTPTAAALERALDYFAFGAGREIGGERYVLLVTDGGPMCNTDLVCEAETCTVNIDGNCPEVVGNCCDAAFDANHLCLDEDGPREQIEALHERGIRTAVMGIPGTAAYAAQLNEYAEAGGLENTAGETSYYAVAAEGGVQALEAALTAITRQLIQTCVLELDETPPDPQKVNVRIDGEIVPQQGEDGWELVVGDAGSATVTLKGTTCERVEEQGVESISVLFGCPTIFRAPAAR
jgi:hypothetical protein